MADLKYYDIILRPVVTEKSMNAMADKKYAFYVSVDATKSQVKEAVEKMFPGTKVASVNTMNLAGKTRRRNSAGGIVSGKTAAKKKAIVQLTADSADIELFTGL
ncbi:MAG: 50S ribosomal protein L23 [Lachnospiraceae bacterium]|nr:50S ribosomal protein L23 [Lachnospiraceae bacterium]